MIYIQTVIGPEQCPACRRMVNQLWERVNSVTNETIERRCALCAIQEGWS